MYGQNDLSKIKTSLTDNVGHKVKLTAKKGRKQYVTREGVIESTYPSIFTVKLDNESQFFTTERRVSYSYADVLTKSVELEIYAPEEGELSMFSGSKHDDAAAESVLDEISVDEIEIDEMEEII